MNTKLSHPITLTLLPILQGLCIYPNGLQIIEEANDRELTIVVCPEQIDRGTIVGKMGRCLDAINAVVSAAGERIGIKADVQVDSDKPINPRHRMTPFAINDEFGVDEVVALVRPLAEMALGPVKLAAHKNSAEEAVVVVKPLHPCSLDLIKSISDIFFSLGYRQGRIIKIKPANDETTKSHEPRSKTNPMVQNDA